MGEYGGTKEIIPINLKIGLSYSLPFIFLKEMQSEIILIGDIDTKYNYVIHGGIEYWWNKIIGLRGGIKYYSEIENISQQDAELSIGASIRWLFIGIDYAYIFNEIEPSHYFSVGGKF